MHHVLIAGNDIDGVRRFGGFAGEGADHVISLEACQLENRNAVGFERAANVRELLRQILRHGGAVGLVAFVFNLGESLRLDVEFADLGDCLGLLVAERRRGYIENGSQILRRKIVTQLPQHVDEDKNRSRGQAGLRRHGPLPRHGVIGAEDERHGIDEKDAAVRRGSALLLFRDRGRSGRDRSRGPGIGLLRLFSWRQPV